MAGVFQKLNLKDHDEIVVVNAPVAFEKELKLLKGVRIHRHERGGGRVAFALVFVQQKSELDRLAKLLAQRAEGDAVLWFAYPKGSSKKLSCDFNRDNGWDAIRAAGFDSVRQVAIDADWSALRFRRQEFIARRS
jgi:hypothetical protein